MQLPGRVVAALRRAGFDTRWRAPTRSESGPGVDGVLEVVLDGREVNFPARVFPQLRLASVALLDLDGEQGAIVLAESVGGELARRLQATGIGYVDARGNAHLRGAGFLMHIEGRAAAAARDAWGGDGPFGGATSAGGLRRVLSPAAMPVTLAVLVRPEILGGTVREVAALAGSSVGTVHGVLAALRGMGVAVSPEGQLAGGRGLLEMWTREYLGSFRERLGERRFVSALGVAEAGAVLGRLGPLTGESAAVASGIPLRAIAVDCYARGDLGQLIIAGRLTRDSDGWVSVREAFWSPVLDREVGNAGEGAGGIRLAPAPVVRADMLAVDDARLTDAARAMMADDETLRRLAD